ncbi:MAG: SUMF1/EgtB/PvdO family nonheme iron enzyme [Anaerolinea sp.]|nr:SUMF1/EgtB/PvdO family nonheme iron enzyme [Anaerolinea sp.]
MVATLKGSQSERYASCVARFTELLFPLVWSENDRKAFLSDAYLTNNSWFMRQVDLRGASDPFCTHFLETLLGQDCVLLEPLRPALLRHYGGDRAPDIEQLLADLRQLCQTAYRQTPAAAPRPLATPLMEADAAHRPTLFLSYAAEESSLAAQLRHNLAWYGHACWRDRPPDKGSDAWLAATAAGLNNSYALVLLVGPQTWQDRWVRLELLAAADKRKPILLLQLPDAPLPPLLAPPRAVIPLDGLADVAFQSLLAQLPSPPAEPLPVGWAVLTPELVARAAELVYMDRLKLAELRHVAQYTPLSGQSAVQRAASGRLQLQPVVARQEFDYVPWSRERALPLAQRRFEDAVAELKAIRRAALLGDPGSGKTTTFYKLAADLIETALADPAAPIPLMVRLGLWTDAAELFAAFLRRSVEELGEGLEGRLAAGRAALLLDGINEIPAGQQAAKYRAVGDFLAQHPRLLAWVSCREQDYPPDRDLRLGRVTVAPLDAVRVGEFIHNYLDALPDFGRQAATDLFWQLAGAAAQVTHQRFMAEVGPRLADPERIFWLDGQLPDGLEWGHWWEYNWQKWLKERARPASLLLLATNPYMLFMLLQVYQDKRAVPANRGQLFDWFVERLLLRERLFAWDRVANTVVRQAAGESLLTGLTELAYEMQRRTAADRAAGALTALPLHVVAGILDERQRYQAASANLLALGDEVRFTHQLLQEYFVARAMRERIFPVERLLRPGSVQVSKSFSSRDLQNRATTSLRAADIWQPKTWWEPTNWEEATILLAGLYSDDCTPVLLWLAEAQPELAARCIMESGAYTPDETKLRLRELWLPRLTDLKRDPDARARAAVGRALGRVVLEDGTPLDNRPGVGFVLRNGLKIPDIAWGEEVSAGKHVIGGDKEAWRSFNERPVTIQYPYRLARYPVTNAQFACFVTAPDFGDGRWWHGLPDKERQVDDTYFPPYANGPREKVSWYQAVAFCRWLSDKLGYMVELPHEYEWEVAARWPDNRLYPWGNEFDAAKANTSVGNNVGQPTAVGIYPASELGLYDLSGNVWEWCRNKDKKWDEEQVDDSNNWRVLRGGSWDKSQNFARAACRNAVVPGNRNGYDGFRVVVVRHSPSHHPDH